MGLIWEQWLGGRLRRASWGRQVKRRAAGQCMRVKWGK